MTDESTIGARLRELMEAAQVSENELARRADVPQPTIHRILNGTSKSPRSSNLEKIAQALGTSTSYLAYGETTPRPTRTGAKISAAGSLLGPLGSVLVPVGLAIDAMSNARQKPASHVYNYPFLEWRQTATLDAITSSVIRNKNSFESSSYKAQGIGFWLEIKGDAMSAPPGASPSLPEGTKVLFDTGLTSVPGKLVLAQLPDTPAPTFRKLIEDSGHCYLQPLNPSFPLISLDKNCSILAVAVEAKTLL
ncbi:XRE family transcriptional regulator [Halomonas sp. 25-S5]|uniref:helix-turn-helix domain-containing protein n=1 Tax=Halomonas sp. 25-S5 TaxID=2994065 RepID=UPI002468DC87|nr:XRE family transcriptional regulator [Halomonas sp. 25-S5]